jgi:hypothetical protein
VGEDGSEALDGAEGDDIGAGVIGSGGEGFGSAGEYGDIRRGKVADVCRGKRRHEKNAGGFAEEGGLFVVRFDHGQLDWGRPDFEREGGESCAGADIEDVERIWQRGENSLRHFRCAGSAGVLRLRRSLRGAKQSASLRMTVVDVYFIYVYVIVIAGCGIVILLRTILFNFRVTFFSLGITLFNNVAWNRID